MPAGASWERLTFADDGSATSDDAWAWLTAQHWPGWRVDVVRAAVVAPEATPGRSAPRQCGLSSVRTITSPLDPRTALTSHAGTDLLVLGGRTGGGSMPTALGGTTEWFVAHGPSPVVVARRGGPVRHVVACVDHTRRSQAALAAFLEVPLSRDAFVTVVTVMRADGHIADEAQAAVDHLRDLGIRAERRVVEAGPVIATSNPKYALLDSVRLIGPDLVVIGTPWVPWVPSALSGSATLDVVRSVRCSVLVGPGRTPGPEAGRS